MEAQASQRKKFDELIDRLQGYARDNPRGYRSRVLWLGLAGYGYILLILLALLALIGVIIYLSVHYHSFNAGAVKFLIFSALVAAVIIRSLWVKLPPPQGLLLQRREWPRLFELLSGIAASVKAPLPDTVLLTDDFNASISQLPRLGIFGWHKNYLCLGLPLMQVLTEEEFKSVLAHEFGHISAEHGRTGCWIYRIRETWSRLYDSFRQDRSPAVFLFMPFFKWYVPYFAAYSFVLAREQEYEADRKAAGITSPTVLSRALLLLNVKGAQSGYKAWPEAYRLVSHQPEPPANVFGLVADGLKQDVPEGLKWLRHALNVRTHNADTHPCLSDRIKALGCGSMITGPLTVPQAASLDRSAAQAVFGDRGLPDITSRMNKAWQMMMVPTWKERYEYVRREKPALEKILAGQDLPEGISENGAVELVQKIEDISGTDAAFPLIRKILDRFPSNAPANYRYGELLLGRDDPAGIAFLEKAVSLNSLARSNAFDEISAFYERQGEHDKARKYYDEAGTHEDIAALAYAERQGLENKDVLEPAGLPPGRIEELRARFAPVLEQVQEVYLARKRVKYAPEDPLWVVYITSYSPVFKYRKGDFPQRLADQAVNLLGGYFDNGGYLVLVDQKAFRSKFKKVEGALVYRRGRK